MKKEIKVYFVAICSSLLIYFLSYTFAEMRTDNTVNIRYVIPIITSWLDILRWTVPGLIVGYYTKSSVLLNGFTIGTLTFLITFLIFRVVYETKKVILNNFIDWLFMLSFLGQELLIFMLATMCGRFLAKKETYN